MSGSSLFSLLQTLESKALLFRQKCVKLIYVNLRSLETPEKFSALRRDGKESGRNDADGGIKGWGGAEGGERKEGRADGSRNQICSRAVKYGVTRLAGTGEVGGRVRLWTQKLLFGPVKKYRDRLSVSFQHYNIIKCI